MQKIVVSLLFLLFVTTYCHSQNYDAGGLYFNSYLVNKDHRTSLCLTHNEPFVSKKSFRVEMDVSFLPQWDFGYICRILDKNKKSVDLVYSPNVTADSLFLKLIVGGKLVHKEVLDSSMMVRNKWHHLVLSFNHQNDSLVMQLEGHRLACALKDFASRDELQIYFGAKQQGDNVWTDVPGFLLKEVGIRDDKGRLIHFWPLNQAFGEVATDLAGDMDAKVINPVWEINKHHRWHHKATFRTAVNSGITWLPDHQALVNTCPGRFKLLSVDDGNLYEYPYANAMPGFSRYHTTYWNAVRNKLVAYNKVGKVMGELDLQTYHWTVKQIPSGIRGVYQHVTHFNSQGELVIIGGYDWLHYFNEYSVTNLDSSVRRVKNLSKDVLAPRYLLGGSYQPGKDQVYLFGGYGNREGDQSLGMQNFYDLFSLDLTTQRIEKIWELEDVKANFVPVKNLITVNNADSTFFTLCYSNHHYYSSLRLCEFSSKHPSYQVLSDSIPYFFKDIESDANLYFNDVTREFVAYTRCVKYDTAVVDVYTLKYPPVPVLEKNSGKTSLIGFASWFKWGGGLITGIIILFIVLYRRKRKPSASILPCEALAEPENIITDEKNEQISAPCTNYLKLFGDACLSDADGVNLFKEMSPKIQELFLVIYFKTLFQGGVSSKDLTHLLWDHLEGASAKNTRNVNISRLRKFLKALNGIELEYVDSKYTFHMEEPFDSDYQRLMDIMRKFSDTTLSVDEVRCFCLVLQGGPLLKGHGYEWLDKMHEHLLNHMLDVFDRVIGKPDIKNDPKLLLIVSEAVLIHDTTNEEACLLKIYALKKLGRRNVAKVFYEKYTATYLAIYNQSFNSTFEECWDRTDISLSIQG